MVKKVSDWCGIDDPPTRDSQGRIINIQLHRRSPTDVYILVGGPGAWAWTPKHFNSPASKEEKPLGVLLADRSQ